MVPSGRVVVLRDARILAEYREVLLRPEFGFDRARVEEVLDGIRLHGETVVGTPLVRPLRDPDDSMFLEVALGGRAEALVTGNLKDFPPDRRAGIAVLSPAESLRRLARRGGRA